jgi:hypothetical protein
VTNPDPLPNHDTPKGRRHTTHGNARVLSTPARKTYYAWVSMRKRCSASSRGAERRNYFERGIRVCQRWSTFDCFVADMGVAVDGQYLDRTNNDGNYEPSNCRWVTAKENGRNKRTSRLNPEAAKVMRILFTKKLATIALMARLYGVKEMTASCAAHGHTWR